MAPLIFEQRILLEQRLKTGSTVFLLSGLEPIALKVFFGLRGGLDFSLEIFLKFFLEIT